jgi:hypothetical protein
VRAVVSAAIVATAVVLAYRPALDGGFLADDYGFLAQRVQHGALESLWIPWGDHFIPTYRLVVCVQWALFGLEPAGYHACSLALHALNSLLVLMLGVRLTNDPPAATAGALLFAFFPPSAGTVLFVNYASLLCATTAVLLTLHALIDDGPPPRPARHPGRLVAAAVATAAALGCHGAAWVVVAAPLAVAWVTRSRAGIVGGLGAVAVGVAASLVLRAALARPELQHLGPIARLAPTEALQLDASGAWAVRSILPYVVTGIASRLVDAVSPPGAPPWYALAGAAVVGIWLAGLARSRLAWAGAALAVGAWAGIFVRRVEMWMSLATTDRYWYLPGLGVAFLMIAGAAVSRSRAWRAVTGAALAAVVFAAVQSIERSGLEFLARSERAGAVVARYRGEMARYLGRVRPGTALTFENGFVSRWDVGPFVHKEQIFRLAFPERPEVRFIWPEEGPAALVWNPFVRGRVVHPTPIGVDSTSAAPNDGADRTPPSITHGERGARSASRATDASPGSGGRSR